MIPAGAFSHVAVAVDEAKARFYINGTLVWSGDDPSLSAGRVGFGFYSIDWVFVDSATLSTTLLPAGEAVVSPAQAAINEAAQRRGGGTIDEAPPR